MVAVEAFLTSFVPTALAAECSPNQLAAEGRHFDAAVLLADLSGFTALAEGLAERAEGAELLTEVLNDVFGLTLDVLAKYGGSPTKFAGDSTIAIWKADDHRTLSESLGSASACALALQNAMAARRSRAGETLRLRIGVAGGRVWAGRVGGIEGRWEHLLEGIPVADAGRLAAGVAPGEVAGAIPTTTAFQVPPDRSASPLYFSREMLAAFIPRMVAERAAAGQHEWLAEFRRVSVVFLNIGAVDTGAPDVLPRMHAVMRAVQQAVYRYDGSVNQVVADDKGTSFLLAWNLPSLAREDAAVRAVRAALAAQKTLLELGVRCSVGVATGRAFCGLRGAATRREYAVVGAVVNRAARLMQASGGSVRVDDATMMAASRRIRFESSGTLSLKGVAAPVAIFSPAGETTTEHHGHTVIGRADDLAVFDQRLSALKQSQRSAVVMFEGEPGIGKSVLMAACADRAREAGVRILAGASDAVETATPYFAWRRVFDSVLDRSLGPRDRIERLVATLAGIEDAREKLPLIAPLLSLEIDESDTTRRMTPEARADQTRELLTTLIEATAEGDPIVVLLDDAHWFDSASWGLLAAVARRPHGVLLVVGTRPLEGQLSVEASTVVGIAGEGRRVLSPMAEGDVLSVVCERLGVWSLPQMVTAFIHRKAAGNPFFSEQLAFALRDGGHLIVDEDSCRLAPGITDLDRLDLPSTVEGVLTGRVDSLEPGSQLTLKVASVIGRAFRAGLLEEVHPLGPSAADLAGHLEELVRRDLVIAQVGGPDPEYLFKHVIVQNVTYGLMSFTQRRGLHFAVARLLEARHADDLDPHLGTLAHHWRQTGEIEKAVGYLERAATRAFESSANEDTVRLAGDAIALAHTHSLTIETIRLARWKYWRGFALFRLGQFYPASDELRGALALLGEPTPTAATGVVGQLVREVTRQAFRRLIAMRRLASSVDRPALALAANIYHRYLEVIFSLKGPLWSIAGTSRALNISEPLGRSPELGMTYAITGFWVGTLGLARLANRYYEQALPMVEEANHPGLLGTVCMSRTLWALLKAEWDDAEAYLQRGIEAYQRAGDKSRVEQLLLMRSNCDMQRARHHGAREWLDRARETLWPYGSYQFRVWALTGQLIIACRERRSEPETVRALLAELAAEPPNEGDRVLALGLIARQRVLMDGGVEGWSAATAALAAAEKTPPSGFHVGMGLHSLTEAYLDIVDAQRNADDRERARRESARACRALSRLARMAPPTVPAARLAMGSHFARFGPRRSAVRELRAAIKQAQWRGQRYELAHAHAALASVLDDTTADAAHHRSTAMALFSEIGVPPARDTTRGAADAARAPSASSRSRH